MEGRPKGLSGTVSCSSRLPQTRRVDLRLLSGVGVQVDRRRRSAPPRSVAYRHHVRSVERRATAGPRGPLGNDSEWAAMITRGWRPIGCQDTVDVSSSGVPADRPDVWLYGDGSRLARSDRREPTCGQGSRAGVKP
jgi:hypothetical protein